MIPTTEWCRKWFRVYNEKYFDNKLPMPNFDIKIERNGHYLGTCSYEYGSYDRTTRKMKSLGPCTIRLSDQYDLEEYYFQRTLIHEMGHYYVNYIMQIYPTNSHGKEFAYALRKAEVDGWKGISNKYAEMPPERTLSTNGQALKDKLDARKEKKLSKPCFIGFIMYKDGHVFGFKTEQKYVPLIEKRYLKDEYYYAPKINGIDWYECDNEQIKLQRSCNTKIMGHSADSVEQFAMDREKYYGELNLTKVGSFRYSNNESRQRMTNRIIENIINSLKEMV